MKYPLNLINVNGSSSFTAPLQLKPPFIPLSTVPQYFSTSSMAQQTQTAQQTTKPLPAVSQPATLLQLPPQAQAELLRKGLPRNALILPIDQMQNFKKMMNGKMQNQSQNAKANAVNGKIQSVNPHHHGGNAVDGVNAVSPKWRKNNNDPNNNNTNTSTANNNNGNGIGIPPLRPKKVNQQRVHGKGANHKSNNLNHSNANHANSAQQSHPQRQRK